MIEFNSENDFELKNLTNYETWLDQVSNLEGKIINELGYVFCSDEYLIKINQQYLNHNTYTDIITFDYCEGVLINGEIYISTDRIKENAANYKVEFHTELLRVMVHGLLHLIGYPDKSDDEKKIMRSKEDFYIKKFKSNI